MLQSRKFYYILFVLGALYVLLVQQFFQNEARFIFETPKYESETTYNYTTAFQELNLPINRDLSLHGIWFKHENSEALILLFPTADIDFKQLEIHKNLYYSNGFDVLITSYRGTAKSTGKLETEDDLFSDAQHWYSFAKAQFPEKNIIIVGQGFGASISAQLAGNNQAKALILENPYFSFKDYQSSTKYWWLPYSYFTSFSLNTWEYVRKTGSEIIFIQDESKRGQENCLINFMKPSDKIYWLENHEDSAFSFQADKTFFFDAILKTLKSPAKSRD